MRRIEREVKKFKYMPSLPMTYAQQGAIWFTCQTFRNQPKEVQLKIRELCTDIGGGDAMKRKAILAFMTTRISWRECCDKHYISDNTLHLMRRRFFEEWRTYNGEKQN